MSEKVPPVNCDAVRRWLDPLLDGELDSKNTVEIQAHLDTCPQCQQCHEAKRAVSANLRRLNLGYTAPESLRARISAALEAEQPAAPGRGDMRRSPDQVSPGPRRSSGGAAPLHPAARWFLWTGWPVALAASALLATMLLHERDLVADTIVADHVRSLLANHLSDVESSSHHTVKPWFAGKIDFSPPVPDLSAQGYELVGGRLDYLEHQPVAAVVYRKHRHVINVLVSRPGSAFEALPHIARAQGYALRSWQQGGLDVVAVSDIDSSELANFEQAYTAPPPLTPEPPNTP